MSVFFVAEIGSLWDGSPALGYRMIREASLAGADAIKIQLGWDPADPVRGASDKHVEFLRDATHEFGMQFGASFFSLQGLDNGRKAGLDFYKIPSQKTYSDSVLVAEVLKDQRPTWVSHGMLQSSEDIIQDSEWFFPNIHNVWCVSQYPTYIKHLKDMPSRFHEGYYEGYSDHVHGIESCLLAIARGAMMVETHFTLSPANQTIRDHAFAKTPAEFAELIRLGRRLNQIVEAAR